MPNHPVHEQKQIICGCVLLCTDGMDLLVSYSKPIGRKASCSGERRKIKTSELYFLLTISAIS